MTDKDNENDIPLSRAYQPTDTDVTLQIDSERNGITEGAIVVDDLTMENEALFTDPAIQHDAIGGPMEFTGSFVIEVDDSKEAQKIRDLFLK
jgi:hypothetical protein